MDEELLAQEVLYLHSLWYIGPPNPNPYPNFSPNFTPHPNFAPNFTPYPNFTPHHYHYPNSTPNCHLSYPNPRPLHNPSSSSIRPYNRQPKKQRTDPVQEKEWPCDPTSLPDKSAPATWPPLLPSIPAPPTSPDSSSRSALLSMQFPAIQSCKSFFTPDSESEPNSDSESENDSNIDSFFKDLFENDVGVCYEKDHEKGEFYCLVCESQRDGKKGKGMRHKGCVALTQHASTVLKEGWTRAHRAFARAICRVLGWDATRLPSIVLLPGSLLKINEAKEIMKEPNSDSNPNSPMKEITNETNSNPNPNSNNVEWPACPTPFPNPNPPVTWAATLAAAPPPPGITAQSEALAKAGHIQRRAIKSTGKFLSILEEEYSGSDSEISDLQPGSNNSEVNSSDFDFDSEEESEERPDMEEFFVNIFKKDHRLREYYEKNVEKGDFYCFVCQVRKDFKRKGMRYKSGLALVQHANTFYKEGGRGAHRALARVVCRVFGWDPLCLPGSVKEEKEKDDDSKDVAKEVEEESEKDEKIGAKSDENTHDTVELLDSPLEKKDCPSISA